MSTQPSEYFEIDEKLLDEYGAFNVSIINDLPLFIDPFLLFHSQKEEYQILHKSIVDYVIFLKNKAALGSTNIGLLRSWYCFSEIKQNWLGFSIKGNSGTGLGMKFAYSLHNNLTKQLKDFGRETISDGSHVEKVCLIEKGVGRDNISDFTTNLILDYLCGYTQKFADLHLKPDQVGKFSINRAVFNYATESWERRIYRLPLVNGDYVILTPKDILTRDENWINRGDLIAAFDQIPTAISNEELQAQVSNYFSNVIARPIDRAPNEGERGEAAVKTMLQFPELLDYYIKIKEDSGNRASDISSEKVLATHIVFVKQIAEIQQHLKSQSNFYKSNWNTYTETHARLAYLKDVIENKGGYRVFYHKDVPIGSEKDLQILFRLVWFGTPSDAGTEANDGRGPVDFKISRGAEDKTLVEMKLAKNTQLERNLAKQLPIYLAASDAQNGIKAIVYFTKQEQERLEGILEKLGILGHKDIVVIDARKDNKPSGSKA